MTQKHLLRGLPTFSVGIDLVEVRRFVDLKPGSQFLKNTFTSRELRECKSKPSSHESLAARFAAKEAVRKCITENLKFNRIEITNTKSGSPRVTFLDQKLRRKYRVSVSLTHTPEYAQAACLAVITS